MPKIEKIDEPGVLPLDDSNFQRLHETTDREPKIISHHHDALQPSAITLPQGLHQLRVFFPSFRMKPLLELVQYQ